MSLDKEDILMLAEALRAKDPREMAQQEALIASHNAKRDKLEKETKKSKTHAFYRATGPGFITGIGRIDAGQIIALPFPAPGTHPMDVMRPSHTWEVVPPDEDTTAAEPKPEQPKAPAAVRIPESKPQAGKPRRAADEDS
jgi:hypothetical protein